MAIDARLLTLLLLVVFQKIRLCQAIAQLWWLQMKALMHQDVCQRHALDDDAHIFNDRILVRPKALFYTDVVKHFGLI